MLRSPSRRSATSRPAARMASTGQVAGGEGRPRLEQADPTAGPHTHRRVRRRRPARRPARRSSSSRARASAASRHSPGARRCASTARSAAVGGAPLGTGHLGQTRGPPTRCREPQRGVVVVHCGREVGAAVGDHRQVVLRGPRPTAPRRGARPSPHRRRTTRVDRREPAAIPTEQRQPRRLVLAATCRGRGSVVVEPRLAGGEPATAFQCAPARPDGQTSAGGRSAASIASACQRARCDPQPPRPRGRPAAPTARSQSSP